MPIKSRIDASGAIRHIIARGIERRQIFKNEAKSWQRIENIRWSNKSVPIE